MADHPTSDLVPTSPRPSRRTSATAFAGASPDADDPLLNFAPYLHPHPRRNSITPAKRRAFIAALAATGIVTQAARSIGVSLEALYKLRRLGGAEGFAAAWEAALDHGVARLEDCALALAIEGEELPIVSGGALLGTYRKHNFGFIRFLLAQRRGERFSEGTLSQAALVPGHPVYDKLKAGWDAAAAAANRTAYYDGKAAMHRHMLMAKARQWEHFKTLLRERGAEAMLAGPSAVEQVKALAPGEMPPGFKAED